MNKKKLLAIAGAMCVSTVATMILSNRLTADAEQGTKMDKTETAVVLEGENNLPSIPVEPVVALEEEETIQVVTASDYLEVKRIPEEEKREDMAYHIVLTTKRFLKPGDTISVETAILAEKAFPLNVDLSNHIVLDSTVSAEDISIAYLGRKIRPALGFAVPIRNDHILMEKEDVVDLGEDPLVIKLSLEQSARLESSKTVLLFSSKTIESLADGIVVKSTIYDENIIVEDTDDGLKQLRFQTIPEREIAQNILNDGGFLAHSIEAAAIEYRMSCGIKTCLGSIKYNERPETDETETTSQPGGVMGAINSLTNLSAFKG